MCLVTWSNIRQRTLVAFHTILILLALATKMRTTTLRVSGQWIKRINWIYTSIPRQRSFHVHCITTHSSLHFDCTQWQYVMYCGFLIYVCYSLASKAMWVMDSVGYRARAPAGLRVTVRDAFGRFNFAPPHANLTNVSLAAIIFDVRNDLSNCPLPPKIFPWPPCGWLRAWNSHNACSQTNEIPQKPRRICFILRTQFVSRTSIIEAEHDFEIYILWCYSAVYYSNVDNECWIGLFKSLREVSDRSTYWLDWSTSTYRNWHSTEPNSTYQCVFIANGKFYDGDCDNRYRYICKAICFC